jgi:hypothetical protein
MNPILIGSAIIPILTTNLNVTASAFDFSSEAITVLKEKRVDRLNAFVLDITKEELPTGKLF